MRDAAQWRRKEKAGSRTLMFILYMQKTMSINRQQATMDWMLDGGWIAKCLFD
jgi:hypothetical protein